MRRFVACVMLAGLLAACGCSKTRTDTLQDVMDRMTGKADKAEVENKVSGLYDPQNPDRVREGIQYLSDKPWGLKEPYLAKYASLAAEHEDETVRAAAVRAMSKAFDDAAAQTAAQKYLPVLVKATADKSALVRWDAVRTLDAMNGEGVESAIIRAAGSDESSDVRSAAARALRNHRDQLAIDALLRCLGDQSFAVRYEARQSLSDMTGYDLGYDPQDWADAIGGKPLPAVIGVTARPWWDWLGLTGKPKPTKPAVAAVPSSQPAETESAQPATSQPS